MDYKILEYAAKNVSAGKKAALILVTDTRGSSPSHPGQMICVQEDGTFLGTIGGGASEFKIIQKAIDAMKNNQFMFEFDFDHKEEGMVCGGGMKGFGKILEGYHRVLIFGGGHIAQKLAPMAELAGFQVTVIEDREEYAKYFEKINYQCLLPHEYENNVTINENTYIVICTRGHHGDEEALNFCIHQTSAYLGVIGSSQKSKLLLENLKNKGMKEDKLKKIFTPIGLNIASKSPGEIAVSILAEMIMIKNIGTAEHKKMI